MGHFLIYGSRTLLGTPTQRLITLPQVLQTKVKQLEEAQGKREDLNKRIATLTQDVADIKQQMYMIIMPSPSDGSKHSAITIRPPPMVWITIGVLPCRFWTAIILSPF